MKYYNEQICYCKKTYLTTTIDGFSVKIQKGKYYKFYFEDVFMEKNIPYAWVIYDENGKSDRQGIRFHCDKIKVKIVALDSFYEFFEYGRLMKLKKLNNLI